MLQHQEQQTEQNTLTAVPQPLQNSESNWAQDSRTNVVYVPEEKSLEVNSLSFEELLAQLKAETARIKRQKKIINYTLGTIGGLAVGTILISAIVRHDWNLAPYMGWTGLFSAGASAVLSDKGRKAANQLSQFNDIRMAGVFVEVLEDNDKKIVSLATTKLIELLPQMQASDGSLLNTEQRTILNHKLLTADGDFVRVVLKAYEQIGDSAAIPFVEKLSRGEGKSESDAEIVSAASACLPFLVQRAKQQEQAQTLLRASVENSAAPETLLRAATATLETQPETLLHPTQQ